MVGGRIGPYRIVAEIGRGGMGVVYRARRADGEFDAEVAIKVVSHGLNPHLAPERFRAERQIQARLGHPNIVRLLDGGTTEQGLTYFVMEFIEGQSLARYCESLRLTVTERLVLFRKICDAVAYAHRNLIIHRDLKPDNILVAADGTPKLLDFGIAKILEAEDDGDLTQTMVRMGTPAYSSPEQIRGEPAGIATDIYSLGVILYELLAGKRPYRLDSLGWEESARLICERDATRPSSVVLSKAERARLAGDLDNIVSLAMRKDPARRYRSVDALSEDIQNHLEGRPVKARGDSLSYKTGKLVQRHKVASALALILGVLFLAASAMAMWQAHRLAARLDEDRKLATSFLVNVHGEIAKLPGATPVREALLTKSLEYLNGLARDAGKDREMRGSLALAYERFAELQVGIDGAGFGSSVKALKTYKAAKAIREALAREQPGNRTAQYDLASNYLLGSYITGRSRSVEERSAYDKKALAIGEQLVATAPKNRDYQALLAKAYTSLAYGNNIAARWQEALAGFQKALSIRKQLAAEAPSDADAQREVAMLGYRMAVIETQSGNPREAIPHLRDTVAIQTRLLEADPTNVRLRSDVASTDHFLGVALGETGHASEALEHFREAISIRERALAADERDARTRSLLAGNYAEQSTVLLVSGDKPAALRSIQHAISLQSDLLAIDPQGVPARLSLADYNGRLAAILAAQGKERDAALGWQRSLAIYDQLDREGHLQASDVRADAEKVRTAAAQYKVK